MRVITALFAISCAALSAQNVPLSLKQAIDIALAPDGNTRVQLAAQAIEQSKTRVGQARAALLPNLDGSVSGQNFTRNLRAFGISFPSNIPGFSMPTIVGPITNFDARLNASMTLFDFSAWKRLGASKTGVEAAEAEADAARNNVADAVARAYIAALRAGAALQVAQANLSLAESLRKLAADQKDAGTGTGIEVLRSEVQLANERQRQTLLENDKRRAYLQLARLLNLGLDKPLELTDSLAMPEANVPAVEEALKAALANRKDLSAQTLRQQIAKRNYDAVKWERLPSVQAFGDYGAIGLDVESAVGTRTYGATLRIPIFDGGRRDARRAEAAISLRQDELRTADLRKQVELDVRLAVDAIQASAQQVRVAEEGLQLAERELAQAQRRYTGGVTSNIEVVDAQTRTERARDNRVMALFQYNQARIDLATAMGAIHRIVQ
ncbi:MAG TPA: TolC family protein [Bryobacteraceae bacterium]|nr:TolC family protein [Bryobacteraceae bacterium]